MRKNDLKRLAYAICGLQASELAAIRDVVDRREREVEAELIETEMAKGRNKAKKFLADAARRQKLDVEKSQK